MFRLKIRLNRRGAKEFDDMFKVNQIVPALSSAQTEAEAKEEYAELGEILSIEFFRKPEKNFKTGPAWL